MMELVLSSLLGVLGLAFALALGRQADRGPKLPGALRRLGQLRSGGVERYLTRHNVVVGAAAGVLGGIVLLAYGIAHQGEILGGRSARAYGLWLVGSFLVGVAVAVVAAWVALWNDRRLSPRVALAVQSGLDEALRSLVRGTASGAITGLALALLALTGLVALGLSLAGPDAAAQVQSLASVSHLVRPVGGLALGAAFVALLAQLGGGLFAKVADVGADVGGKIEASLPEDSGDNPATLADLVGDGVGPHHAGTASSLAATLGLSAAAMLVSARVYQANPELPSASATVLFPLIVQAFGLLAACFGVMAVRTNDLEGPLRALARGHLVAALLHALAIAGAAKWLLGPMWSRFAWCAAIGAGASVGMLALTHYFSEPRYRPVRSLAEAARGGGALAALRGVASAGESTIATALVVGGALLASHAIGESSAMASGGILGVAVAALSLLSFAPLVVVNDGVAAVADSSHGLVALTVGRDRPDARARARLLDVACSSTKTLHASLRAIGGAVTCLLVLHVFQGEMAGSAAPAVAQTIDVGHRIFYMGSLAGLLIVAVFGWTVLSRLLQGARGFLFEVRALLATAATPSAGLKPADVVGSGVLVAPPTEGDRGATTPGALPETDWKDALSCVESISRVALRGMLPPAIIGVGVPFAVAVALRFWATGDRLGASSLALVALLSAATSVGTLGALLIGTAGGAWDHAKKYIETGAHGGRYLAYGQGTAAPKRGESPAATARDDGRVDNPAYVAAVMGDTLGDALRGLVGPSILALLLTLAMLALVFLPFFQ